MQNNDSVHKQIEKTNLDEQIHGTLKQSSETVTRIGPSCNQTELVYYYVPYVVHIPDEFFMHEEVILANPTKLPCICETKTIFTIYEPSIYQYLPKHSSANTKTQKFLTNLRFEADMFVPVKLKKIGTYSCGCKDKSYLVTCDPNIELYVKARTSISFELAERYTQTIKLTNDKQILKYIQTQIDRMRLSTEYLVDCISTYTFTPGNRNKYIISPVRVYRKNESVQYAIRVTLFVQGYAKEIGVFKDTGELTITLSVRPDSVQLDWKESTQKHFDVIRGWPLNTCLFELMADMLTELGSSFMFLYDCLRELEYRRRVSLRRAGKAKPVYLGVVAIPVLRDIRTHKTTNLVKRKVITTITQQNFDSVE